MKLYRIGMKLYRISMNWYVKFTKRIFRPLTKSLSNCEGLLEAVIPNHLIRGDVLSKR